MYKYNVTVKTKNSPPIVIGIDYSTNILSREKFLTLFQDFNRYNFAISELEYYFIERIEINED